MASVCCLQLGGQCVCVFVGEHGHDYKVENTSQISDKRGEMKSSICVSLGTSLEWKQAETEGDEGAKSKHLKMNGIVGGYKNIKNKRKLRGLQGLNVSGSRMSFVCEEMDSSCSLLLLSSPD